MTPQLNDIARSREYEIRRELPMVSRARAVVRVRDACRRCDWASRASRLTAALQLPVRTWLGRIRRRTCAECAAA